MSLLSIQAALVDWVVRGSQLDPASVRLQYQNTRETETGSRARLYVGDLMPRGIDGTKVAYDAGADPGEEFSVSVVGLREFPVEVQLFAPEVVERSGVRSAATMALECQMMARMPSQVARFRAVNLGVWKVGNAHRQPVVVGDKFEDRYILELRCSTYCTLAEFSGWIETLKVRASVGPAPASEFETVVAIAVP